LQLPGNDDVLAKAMGGGKVVLGQSGTRADNANAADSTLGTAVATLGPDPRPYLIGFPKIAAQSSGPGTSGHRSRPVQHRDRKGRIVRRCRSFMKANDELVPALAVDMLRVASGAQAMLFVPMHPGFKAWRCRA